MYELYMHRKLSPPLLPYESYDMTLLCYLKESINPKSVFYNSITSFVQMFEHIPFFMDYEFIHELCYSPENVKNSRWKFLPMIINPTYQLPILIVSAFTCKSTWISIRSVWIVYASQIITSTIAIWVLWYDLIVLLERIHQWWTIMTYAS